MPGRNRRALGPHRLAGTEAVAYAPVDGERVDEEQATAPALVGTGGRARRQGGVGVGHLDPDDAPIVVAAEEQGEAPTRDTAVKDGVRGEFGDDEDDGVMHLGPARVTPLGELMRREQPGEAGTAPGGGETLGERTGVGGTLCAWC